MTKKGKFETPRNGSFSSALYENELPQKRKEIKLATIIVIICIFVIVLLVAAIWGHLLKTDKRIYPNVYADGIDLGGMRPAEAKQALESQSFDRYAAKSLNIVFPDQTFTIEPSMTKSATDVDEVVARAVAYGRSGSAIRAWFSYLFSRASRQDLTLSSREDLDADYIRNTVEQLATDVQLDVQETTATYQQQQKQLVIRVGIPGRKLDTETLISAVCEAYASRSFEPINWSYIEIEPETLDLSAYYDKLCRQPQDAYYDAENHSIVEEIPGYGFDLNEANSKLQAAEAGSEIVLRMETLPPEMTAAELESQMFGTKLESRSSPYSAYLTGRTENLRLACEAINGTILNPGEVFSFNETVGERTAERGYKPGTIYAGNGASEEDIGGGICQVASTIFYAALYMDFEQVMREPHMYQVTYVPPGMDAAVFWSSGLDYQFRNNRENPVKIQANITGGTVNITFWGANENDNYVEMTYATLSTFTEPDEEVVDDTKPVGYREQTQTAYTGAVVEAYQKVFNGSGTLLVQRTIKSRYNARPNIYTVGPPEEPLPDDTIQNPDEIPSDTDDNGNLPDDTQPDEWQDFWNTDEP